MLQKFVRKKWDNVHNFSQTRPLYRTPTLHYVAPLWQLIKEWGRNPKVSSNVVAFLLPNFIESKVFLAITSLGTTTTSLNPLNNNSNIKKLMCGACKDSPNLLLYLFVFHQWKLWFIPSLKPSVRPLKLHEFTTKIEVHSTIESITKITKIA